MEYALAILWKAQLDLLLVLDDTVWALACADDQAHGKLVLEEDSTADGVAVGPVRHVVAYLEHSFASSVHDIFLLGDCSQV
jgi:hypothetical protein